MIKAIRNRNTKAGTSPRRAGVNFLIPYRVTCGHGWRTHPVGELVDRRLRVTVFVLLRVLRDYFRIAEGKLWSARGREDKTKGYIKSIVPSRSLHTTYGGKFGNPWGCCGLLAILTKLPRLISLGWRSSIATEWTHTERRQTCDNTVK